MGLLSHSVCSTKIQNFILKFLTLERKKGEEKNRKGRGKRGDGREHERSDREGCLASPKYLLQAYN